MAHHTRSYAKSTHSDSDNLSASEADLIRQQLSEKEKRLNQQAEALLIQQTEIEKQMDEVDDNRHALLEAQRQNEELNRKILELSQTINENKAPVNYTSEMQNILADIQQELHTVKDLPSRFEALNFQFKNMLSKPSNRPPPPLTLPKMNTTVLPTPEPSPNSRSFEISPIRLKDVADSIPKYDGHRITIYQFSTACERALSLISPHHEPYLVQLILSKLTGHAYTAVEGNSYHTVAQLIQRLRLIFGPNKSVNQYRGELGNAFMKPNEDIFDYIERLKELKTVIIDCETNRPNRYYDEWTIDNIEQEVLESFINGLPPDLNIRVRLEGHTGLDDAFIKAIQISKTITAEKNRMKLMQPKATPFLRQENNYNPRPSFYSNGQPSQNSSRSPQPFIKPLIPGRPIPDSPLPIVCRYCKTSGHEINSCRKLAYRKSLESSQISSQSNNPGNGSRVPVINDVRRNVEVDGRQPLKAVRFETPLPTIPENTQSH